MKIFFKKVLFYFIIQCLLILFVANMVANCVKTEKVEDDKCERGNEYRNEDYRNDEYYKEENEENNGNNLNLFEILKNEAIDIGKEQEFNEIAIPFFQNTHTDHLLIIYNDLELIENLNSDILILFNNARMFKLFIHVFKSFNNQVEDSAYTKKNFEVCFLLIK